MPDITNVNKMIFGVNYLGANGGEDVKRLWNSRFASQEAYLIDADLRQNPKELFLQFRQQLQERGQNNMAGVNCLLVFFVDYTAEVNECAIWGLKSVFSNVLHCQMDAVLQFAYVGEPGLDETVIQRANIRKALEKNNEKDVYENYRLCLVGKSVLRGDSGSHWKAVIVFLDLLRRCTSLQNYLPIAGDLGKNDLCFLRYGEYNEVSYQQLVKEVKRLEELLNNSSSTALRALVEKKRNDMVSFVETSYNVNGAMHPQHPDMIVEPRRRIFERDQQEAARRGKNEAYNNAQQRTRAAVELTGEWLRKEIEAYFDNQIGGAEETLQQLFRDASVGIKMKLQPVEMKSVLYLPAYPDPGIIPPLSLRYSEQGVAGEIGAYLTYIRNNGICNGLQKYSAALQSAYEAIPQEQLLKQKEDLEKAYNQAVKALAEELNEADFCKEVTLNNPPESVFEINTEMNVRSAKFLLCRNGHLPVAQQMAALGSIMVNHVNEQMCGIVSFDDCPVKTVMIENVECREWVLDQLLPEVNYGT